MIMAFTVDTRAALVFAVTIPVLFAVILALLIVCIPLYKRVQSALDRVLSSTRENLAGVRVIRAFCKENDEIEAFSLRHGALTRLQLHGCNHRASRGFRETQYAGVASLGFSKKTAQKSINLEICTAII